MDSRSTDWRDGLLEVALAINTKKHSETGCALAEVVFRGRTIHHILNNVIIRNAKI